MTMRNKRAQTPDEQYANHSAVLHYMHDPFWRQRPGAEPLRNYGYECPCCGKQWKNLAGRKVGFVKAGADRHVYVCGIVANIAKAFGLSHEAAKRKREALWRAYRKNN